MDEHVQNLISGFLNGRLTLSEERELLDWAKKNREKFYKKQKKLERQLQFGNSPEAFNKWKQLESRIRRREGMKGSVIRLLLRSDVFKIAAGFLVGIMATSAILFQWTPLKEHFADSLEVIYKTPYGAKTHVVLPDSSVVWLNSGSELSCSSGFNKSRDVFLKGEAYFNVTKGRVPFTVHTSLGQVKVKGTIFNVKNYENEAFETTLIKGSVSVQHSGTGQMITLRPGEQSDVSGDKMVVKPVDTGIFTSWINGKLIFNNEPLPKAVRRLERWYNIRIELDDDERLSGIRYNGTIEMESFSEVLRLLGTTAPIRYDYHDKTRTVYIKYK